MEPGVAAGCQNQQSVSSIPSGVGGDGVVAHLGVGLGAEHTGVHEREVRHVEEVLHDARAAGVDDDRVVVVVADTGLVPLREVRGRLRRRPAEGDEHHAVPLAGGEHVEMGVRRRGPARHRRLAHAAAATVVTQPWYGHISVSPRT